MKLRYLQRIYPDVEENFLFDLLHNCDDNAQHVIERLEQMGYRRKELDFGKLPPPPKVVIVPPKESQFPLNVSDKEKSKSNDVIILNVSVIENISVTLPLLGKQWLKM